MRSALAARSIKAGETDLMIAGGVESMTRAPFVQGKADAAFCRVRAGVRHHDRLALRQSGDARQVRLSFDAADRRQRRGRLQRQPRRPGRASPCARSSAGRPPAKRVGFGTRSSRCTIPQKKGDPKIVDTDEHPRPDTTAEALRKVERRQRAGAHRHGRQRLRRERRRVRAAARFRSRAASAMG